MLSAKAEDVDADINADAANVEETNSAAVAPYDPPQPTVINSNGGPPSSSSPTPTRVAVSNPTPVGGVVSPNSVGVVVVEAPVSPPEALAAS